MKKLLLSLLLSAITTISLAADPTIKIAGRVVDDATGEVVTSGKVSLIDKVVDVGPDGHFTFEGVAAKRENHLDIRVLDEDGQTVIACSNIPLSIDLYPVAADTPKGFGLVVVKADKDADLEVRVKGFADKYPGVNAVCMGCHAQNPCQAGLKSQQGWEKVMKLGGLGIKQADIEPFKKKIAAEGFSAEAYRVLRFRDIHPIDIDLARSLKTAPSDYKMPDQLPMLGGTRPMCDTCHSRHMPTGFDAFVRVEAGEKNALCLQCHLR